MKVFCLTLGTRGDLEVFLTLGRSLARRGHAVTIATSRFYASRVEQSGLAMAVVGGGFEEQMRDILAQGLGEVNSRRRAEVFQKQWVRPQFESSRDQIISLAGRCDYFVSNLLRMSLRCGSRFIPGAFVLYDPPASIPRADQWAGPNVGHRVLNLVAMNRELIDPERVWPTGFHFTGFWNDLAVCSEVAEPSPALWEFIRSESPLVVFTMGSMPLLETDQFVMKVVEALTLAHRRGVLIGASHPAWGGEMAGKSRGQIFHAQDAPFDWLFSRASCVVHHCGSGTIAACLRSATPMILAPQLMCQHRYAERLLNAGLAVGIVEPSRCPPPQLAQLIRMAEEDPRFRLAARRWREIGESDGGVEVAANLIESHWQTAGGGQC